MNALVQLGIACGMFKAGSVGRPWTLHPDTHANRVLAIHKKYRTAANETKDYVYKKLLEKIQEPDKWE